ncbi:MAG: hypothetical protein JWR19_737, partial [Pedosphaera sp.]|nr:hypothetical protein [Pedosphaera sp.]
NTEELVLQLIKGVRHFLNSPQATARLCSLKTTL